VPSLDLIGHTSSGKKGRGKRKRKWSKGRGRKGVMREKLEGDGSTKPGPIFN